MKSMFKYLKKYKKESIIAPLFKLLEASFELLVPVVMSKMIDVGIAAKDSSYIVRMGLLLLLLGVVGLICSITAQLFSAKAAVGFGTDLRLALYQHINGMSYTGIDKVGTSTLITRMTNDSNQVQSGVNMVLRLFLRSPFIVFGAMIMAFTIDWKAAVVFVITIPVLSLVVYGIMLATMPLYKMVQRQLDCVLGKTRENLSGGRVVRAFNRQEAEEKEFQEANSLLVQLQVKVGKISALMNPLTYVLINLGIAGVLYVGGVRVNTGALKQGEVVALINYMSQILVELIKLANLIVTISKSLACAGRIEAVFAIRSEIAPGSETEGKNTGESCPEVEFKNASYAYSGTREETISGITFEIRKGAVIGVIGGTGSGKSTLINLLPRFYDATSGSVWVEGRNVKDYDPQKLRELIGLVPQKAVLFAGTIRDNMRWGNPQATDEMIIRALQTAQAWEFVQEKEGGLDYKILQEGKNLSGGQRQRLTIARALVRDPHILILDDSLSALDFATDAKLRHELGEQKGNMTMIFVSQRVSSIRHADQILVLDDGKMAGWGTHDQLMKTCEVYEEICHSQLSKEEAAG